MINKVLFWGSLATIAVLFVENMVSSLQAYVFFDTGSSTGLLVLVSALFGAIAGHSFSGMMKKEEIEDDYNF